MIANDRLAPVIADLGLGAMITNVDGPMIADDRLGAVIANLDLDPMITNDRLGTVVADLGLGPVITDDGLGAMVANLGCRGGGNGQGAERCGCDHDGGHAGAKGHSTFL